MLMNHITYYAYTFFLLLDINECLTAPCLNGGQCIDGVNSYVCRCRAGFTDTNCATSKNTPLL